jgi:hypothetical protein
MSFETFFSMFFCRSIKFITNFEKKYLKKVQKNNFEKNAIFGLFGENRQGGRVNIMADSNLLDTCLKKGLDYEFDIKNNI